MRTYETGLLTCSFCGEDLDFYGKDGSLLKTNCPGCGMSSRFLSENYLAPIEDSESVEIYYTIANSNNQLDSVPPE